MRLRRREFSGTGPRRAFTFVEIMIVIVLLGIIASLVMPRIGFLFKTGKLESSARELTGVLRLARHMAILSGEGAQVVIDPVAASFRIEPVILDAEGRPLDDERLSRSQRRDRERDERFEISGEATRPRTLKEHVFFTIVHSGAPLYEDELPRVVFLPDGSACSATIGIQNEENEALAVVVYRTTGLSKVMPGTPVLPENVAPLYVGPQSVDYGGYR